MNVGNKTLFIPDSFTVETSDLKLKTYKVGLIARAAAVFKINKVIVYKDNTGKKQGDAEFITHVLDYMNTPQYLRRQVFPLCHELKHVGILPPLRTPHHPTETLELGDYRQGLTTKRNKKGTFVDIGADKLAFCKEKLTVNKILSFRVIKLGKEILLEPDTPNDIYWGYDIISTEKNLKNSLKTIKPDLVLATSRLAPTISSIWNEVGEKIKQSKHVAILFGGPYSGLDGSVESSYWDTISINTIPEQGTKTVRTEEAIYSTLSLLNLLFESE